MKILSTFERPRTIVARVDSASDIDTSGYATISNTGTLGTFGSAVVTGLGTATYDLDITVNGTLRQVATAILNTDTWAGICTKIQTALRALTTSTETVAIVNGKIKVTSVTTGSTSTILIAAGTAGSGGGDILAAIDLIGATYVTTLDTPVDGVEGTLIIPVDTSTPKDLGTSGYETISSGTTTFVGATVPALNNTFKLKVSVDGGAYQELSLVIGAGDSWTVIAATIQTALRAATSGLETVVIADGKIKITSVTTGHNSKIRITEGTAPGFLAAISGIANMEAVVDVPVDGVDGATKDFVLTSLNATRSSGLSYTGLKWSYSKATGNLTITDNGVTTSLAIGDLLVIHGIFPNLNNLA